VLYFLTDEHVSPAVARELSKRVPGLKATPLQRWHGGAFMGAEDRLILEEASKESLTLVSYDQRTIRPLLKHWLEQDVRHAGVVLAVVI
jgi:hypothetical protein